MSWDIVVFSSGQKVESIEEIDEALFLPVNFNQVFKKHFANVLINDKHGEIKGENYAIDFFAVDEAASNIMLSLYGEPALFEIIRECKIYKWQIFDTGNGQMIDLDNPEKNGYNNFQEYLRHVLREKE